MIAKWDGLLKMDVNIEKCQRLLDEIRPEMSRLEREIGAYEATLLMNTKVRFETVDSCARFGLLSVVCRVENDEFVYEGEVDSNGRPSGKGSCAFF